MYVNNNNYLASFPTEFYFRLFKIYDNKYKVEQEIIYFQKKKLIQIKN